MSLSLLGSEHAEVLRPAATTSALCHDKRENGTAVLAERASGRPLRGDRLDVFVVCTRWTGISTSDSFLLHGLACRVGLAEQTLSAAFVGARLAESTVFAVVLRD